MNPVAGVLLVAVVAAAALKGKRDIDDYHFDEHFDDASVLSDHGGLNEVTVTKQVPVPQPYPVYLPKPYPVTVEKRIPYPVKVMVPQPYPVYIDKPFADDSSEFIDKDHHYDSLEKELDSYIRSEGDEGDFKHEGPGIESPVTKSPVSYDYVDFVSTLPAGVTPESGGNPQYTPPNQAYETPTNVNYVPPHYNGQDGSGNGYAPPPLNGVITQGPSYQPNYVENPATASPAPVPPTYYDNPPPNYNAPPNNYNNWTPGNPETGNPNQYVSPQGQVHPDGVSYSSSISHGPVGHTSASSFSGGHSFSHQYSNP